jgi:hypothetical protein
MDMPVPPSVCARGKQAGAKVGVETLTFWANPPLDLGTEVGAEGAGGVAGAAGASVSTAAPLAVLAASRLSADR